jgi:hypothetical protein
MYRELAFPFLLTSLLLAGCAEPEPQVVVLPPSRHLAQPDAIPRTPAPTGPIGTVANVRQAEQVKVYGVNRYVDPADPRISMNGMPSTGSNRNQLGLLGPRINRVKFY